MCVGVVRRYIVIIYIKIKKKKIKQIRPCARVLIITRTITSSAEREREKISEIVWPTNNIITKIIIIVARTVVYYTGPRREPIISAAAEDRARAANVGPWRARARDRRVITRRYQRSIVVNNNNVYYVVSVFFFLKILIYYIVVVVVEPKAKHGPTVAYTQLSVPAGRLWHTRVHCVSVLCTR